MREIKKTTPHSSANIGSSVKSANNKAAVVPHALTPSSSSSAAQPYSKQKSNNDKPEEVTHLKEEMQALKQRIASMTQNIDELTDLVKKVSVKEDDEPHQGALTAMISPGAATKVEPCGPGGNKRKKMDNSADMKDLPIMPDWNPSYSDLNLAGVTEDALLLGGDPLPDLATSGGTSPAVSTPPPPDEDAFMDDLFEAFANEGDAIGLDDEEATAAEDDGDNTNKPDPQLMKRIEDSLSTIPRDMHELVANKLIDAISDTRPIVAKSASSFFPSVVEETGKVDRSISMDEDTAPKAAVKEASSSTPSIPLPVAVSALKTILSEYGISVECRRASSCKGDIDTTSFTKSLPVVPMHA